MHSYRSCRMWGALHLFIRVSTYCSVVDCAECVMSRSHSLQSIFIVSDWTCGVCGVTHSFISAPLRWRHIGHDGVSNHHPHDCLLNRSFRRRLKKISKLRVTGLCVGNSPVTGEFPVQMASNAENVSIWWRHHADCLVWHLCCQALIPLGAISLLSVWSCRMSNALH